MENRRSKSYTIPVTLILILISSYVPDVDGRRRGGGFVYAGGDTEDEGLGTGTIVGLSIGGVFLFLSILGWCIKCCELTKPPEPSTNLALHPPPANEYATCSENVQQLPMHFHQPAYQLNEIYITEEKDLDGTWRGHHQTS